ncbi:MAG: carboxypeptidase-like regulatory domain-containing protein, partial [Tannerella sp.]|nr:carboxypeptidase-like regulatory domain-containing protein [Tannerella sp.]
MENNEKKRKRLDPGIILSRLMFTALFSLVAIAAFAQGKTLTGVVLDETGEPVTGANVVVVGTTNGIITDIDGNFKLSNVDDNAKIRVSYVGYMTQDVPVAGKTH